MNDSKNTTGTADSAGWHTLVGIEPKHLAILIDYASQWEGGGGKGVSWTGDLECALAAARQCSAIPTRTGSGDSHQ